MEAPATLLKLLDVSRRYDSPGGASPLGVLEGICLEIKRGESLAVVGPSGSGKSTLLQIIGTLDRPTSGRVLLEGQDLNQLDERQLAAVRNQQLGFVFQAHYLLPQCTVLENVLVPTLATVGQASSLSLEFGHSPLGQPSSLSPSSSGPGGRTSAGGVESEEKLETGWKPVLREESASARATRLLARVGLGERLAHRPGQLSGGERQRVAVVRALVNRPELLLADEPTGSLDHASAQQLGQLLVDLNREEGVALIVVTHALDLARRMGRVLELKDGRLKPA